MEYISLASGSSGNCHFIREKNTKLLIDAGISGKNIINALSVHGFDLKDAKGILITHEHLDHIKGAGIISRKYNIPIYASSGTIKGMIGKIGKISENNIIQIKKDTPFSIGDVEITAFDISHDANEPVMYRLSDSKKSIAVITDVGVITDKVVKYAAGCDTVVLESNHDINMLEMGPYTYELKKRVASNVGHLSNDAAGEFSAFLIKNGAKRIYLAHLSKQNNMPLLAYQSVIAKLIENQIEAGKDMLLSVLGADKPSELVRV